MHNEKKRLNEIINHGIDISQSKDIEIISTESGKHFDPDMVDAFFSCLDVIRSIAKKYPD